MFTGPQGAHRRIDRVVRTVAAAVTRAAGPCAGRRAGASPPRPSRSARRGPPGVTRASAALTSRQPVARSVSWGRARREASPRRSTRRRRGSASHAGCLAQTRAAAPATSGLAKEVPVGVAGGARSGVTIADDDHARAASPGATRSTCGPRDWSSRHTCLRAAAERPDPEHVRLRRREGSASRDRRNPSRRGDDERAGLLQRAQRVDQRRIRRDGRGHVDDLDVADAAEPVEGRGSGSWRSWRRLHACSLTMRAIASPASGATPMMADVRATAGDEARDHGAVVELVGHRHGRPWVKFFTASRSRVPPSRLTSAPESAIPTVKPSGLALAEAAPDRATWIRGAVAGGGRARAGKRRAAALARRVHDA